MKKEVIIHKNKKVTKVTGDKGDVRYVMRGVFLGKDKKTGKQVTTSITAPTLKKLDRSVIQARIDFEQRGSTRKEKVSEISTIGELAEEWFNSYQNWVTSYNTLNRVRGYLDTYIIPRFGDYFCDKLTSVEIQNWINELAEKHKLSIKSGARKSKKGSAKDYGAVLHKLSDILDFGITHYGLTTNPAKSVKIPPQNTLTGKKRIKVLHDDELSKWLNYLDTLPNNRANRKFILICDTLLASALRINELLALTIQDLDTDKNTINVNKTLMWKARNKSTNTKGKVVCKPTPKTDSGNRIVPVSREIINRLVRFHDEMNEVLTYRGLPKSDLIFPTIYGNYMTDRNERATLIKRLREAGLPSYGFHIFRHTHASLLLNAGTNWKELQERMGHKSITTTMDTYAELAPHKKFEAVDTFQCKLEELANKH